MFGNGKKQEVIIKVLPRSNSSTGMMGTYETTLEYDRLDVWAGAGHMDNLKKTPGVMNVLDGGVPVHYFVFVDPRYDLKWVIEEITAMLQIRKPKTSKKNKEIESIETLLRSNNGWLIDYPDEGE